MEKHSFAAFDEKNSVAFNEIELKTFTSFLHTTKQKVQYKEEKKICLSIF